MNSAANKTGAACAKPEDRAMAADAQRVQAVFLSAMRHPDSAGRRVVLERECAGDPDLRLTVEALLRAYEERDTHPGEDPAPPSELKPAETLIGSAPPSITEPLGARIGAYKLLQKLGDGGMGTVYLAEQEVPVRRQVALKIIKPGMDSELVIARFEAERQALALMDHQNIARVLDAGTTDTWRPFFVMELVHGVPITDYCDKNQLTPKARIELLVSVCQAIQHAHQKGIIHRDIKASNVLVTLYDDKAVPKVIDFGVAKAIDQRLTERTMFTQYGSIVGTPAYMSPEQAGFSALGVDTRSDIYSLGVLLYELLTGTTPLEHDTLIGAGYDEILRRIRNEEPAKPSTRVTSLKAKLPEIAANRQTEADRLPRLYRGELDWIVMKALEKDRTRRYETANGLARDLQRYLNGDTVEACPPSASYRLAKFARKYRMALAGASTFAALLVLGAMLSTWQAIRATQAERYAVALAQRASQAEQVARSERDRAVAAETQAKAEEAKGQSFGGRGALGARFLR
jgi:serine/threonine protein kinase